jgi:hypothetical protein
MTVSDKFASFKIETETIPEAPNTCRAASHEVVGKLFKPRLERNVTHFSSTALSGLYSTGSIRSPGAADILSSFLGPAILALAFTLHRQRSVSPCDDGQPLFSAWPGCSV